MNFLYIGFNKRSRFRFLDITLDALGQIGNVYRYGYGFSTEEELAIGIDAWIQKYSISIDFIVCDSWVFECQNIIKREKPFKSAALYFKEEDYYNNAEKFKNYFLSCNYKRLFIANWDYYNLQRETLDFITQNKVYVLGCDKSVNALLNPNEVKFKITNNWYEFSNHYYSHIISANHFLSDNEFNYTPLADRSTKFGIPGTGYAERKKASKLVGLNKTTRYWKAKAFSFMLNKLILTLKSKRDIISIFQSSFDNRISNTKICFTSGSELEVPVRKYFEILGKGTLLVCIKFHGMQHLGFRHMENCIIIKNIEDIVTALEIDMKVAQRIARKGLALIKEKHSSTARVKQWRSSFDLIMKGEFNGSTWVNGKYIDITQN